ncbi:MAG: amidohydrolase family protein [Candidatus Pacebacteria bacterium]|nr:amidohydrolase family protein [Candidatus Paceibacterota bacterium]
MTDERMIIDIHTHLPAKSGVSTATILSEARRLGITRLVNLGAWPLNATPEQVQSANDETMRLVRRHPDTLTGFAFLNPNHEKGFVLGEISRCVENGGLRGIKLEVERNARDPRLDPIMDACASLDIPVLHHSWNKTVGKVLGESSPAGIAHLGARRPRTIIVMAHLTACGMRGILDIEPYPNVYVDTSGSQPFSGIVEYAVKRLGPERILFGSDIPGRDFSCQLGRVLGAGIGARDRDLILGINAERLLQL